MSSRNNNSSFTGILVAGTLSVLAAGLFSLFRSPVEEEEDFDRPSVDPSEVDTGNRMEPSSDEEDSVDDIVSMEDLLEELGLVPNEVVKEVAEIAEKLSDFQTALKMLVENGKVYDKREQELLDHCNELDERLDVVLQQVAEASVVPVKVVVSPEAIPNAEKDAEVLKVINDSIQDLHTRIKTVEGAIRQINVEMKEGNSVTDLSLSDISKVLEETREQVADILDVITLSDEYEPEETCDL